MKENCLHHWKMSVWSLWLRTYFNFQACFSITWNLAICIQQLSLEKEPIYGKSVSEFSCHTHLADLRKGQGSVHGCRLLRAEMGNSQRYPKSSWTSQNQAPPWKPSISTGSLISQERFYFKVFSSSSFLEFHCNTSLNNTFKKYQNCVFLLLVWDKSFMNLLLIFNSNFLFCKAWVLGWLAIIQALGTEDLSRAS